MDTNFKAETPLSEEEARAKYTSTLTLFNAKCNTVEALRLELEEESVELTRLKAEVDRYSAAYLRAVERATLEEKPDMPEAYEKADAVAEAKGKMESRTIGKILGRTEDAPSLRSEGAKILAAVLPAGEQPLKPHSEETAPPAPEIEVSDAPVMFAASGTRPEMDVTEADRDEALLAIPTPGQRRAENISDNVTRLTPERQAEAEAILETVDNILSDD